MVPKTIEAQQEARMTNNPKSAAMNNRMNQSGAKNNRGPAGGMNNYTQVAAILNDITLVSRKCCKIAVTLMRDVIEIF